MDWETVARDYWRELLYLEPLIVNVQADPDERYARWRDAINGSPSTFVGGVKDTARHKDTTS